MADAQANLSATPGPEGEIHRADTGERRRVLLGLALAVISGGLLLLAMTHELGVIGERVATGDMDLAADRFLWLARGSFVLLALVGVATGLVVGKSSLAVIREQRFPHAAARVVRDHLVKRGARAILIGRLGVALALAFVLVGCTGAVIGWRLLASFH